MPFSPGTRYFGGVVFYTRITAKVLLYFSLFVTAFTFSACGGGSHNNADTGTTSGTTGSQGTPPGTTTSGGTGTTGSGTGGSTGSATTSGSGTTTGSGTGGSTGSGG